MKVRSSYHKEFLMPVLAGSLIIHGLAMGLSGWIELSPKLRVESAPSSVEVIILSQQPEMAPRKQEEMESVMSTEKDEIDKTLPLVEAIQKDAKYVLKESPAPEEKPEPEILSPPDRGALVPAVPDEVKNKAPEYPYIARLRGWEGTVILNVRVSLEGHAESVRVEKSSGQSVLDRAAVRAVGAWYFEPAKIGAMPIGSTIEIPIRFVLENNR